jgi:hypothetical protein
LIALIINAHQFERDGIDVEFCLSISNVFFCLTYRASRYMRPLSAQVKAGSANKEDADVKTRFSSRLTRQQAV